MIYILAKATSGIKNVDGECKLALSSLLFLSTGQSFFMLGVKLGKVPPLKALLDEEAKQKKKLKRATLNADVNDAAQWLKAIPDLKQYAALLVEKEITGKRLLQINSDEPLRQLGIEVETDRKYFLLQLARVRAANRASGSCCFGLLQACMPSVLL
jgi:uncharacterized protein YaaQ